MKFQANPKHLEAIRERAAACAVRAADAVTQRVQQMLDRPGDGADHPGEPRQSSAPGKPPTSQSGELAASQRTFGPVINSGGAIAASGSDNFKARLLQVGTAQIAPRPYMLPALHAARHDVLDAFAPGSGAEGGPKQ